MKTELGLFGFSDKEGSIRRSRTLSTTFLEVGKFLLLIDTH